MFVSKKMVDVEIVKNNNFQNNTFLVNLNR